MYSFSYGNSSNNVGTWKPFNPTTYSKDNKEIKVYIQCKMPEYKGKSPLQVRLEDYQQGNTLNASRNQDQRGAGSNNNTGSYGFGNNNNAGSSGFGANNNQNRGFGFGASNNSSGGFGNNNTGSFGFGSNNNSGSGFGANNNSIGGFGANNNNKSFGFNSNNNSGGGLGANNTNFGGFGSNNTNTGGGGFGFGSNNSSNTGGGFGFGSNNKSNTGGGFGFGANNTNTGGGGFGFGANNTNTGGGGFGFGSNNNSNAGGGFGFGSNNKSNTGGGFGFGANNTNTGGGGFGFGSNNKSNTGGFGFGSGNTNTGGGFGFGSGNTNTGGGGFGFGSNNKSNTGGFGFGSGNTNAGGGFGFGANNTNTGGGFGFGSNNKNNTGGGFGFGSGNTNTGGGFSFGANNTNTGGGFGFGNNNSGGFGFNGAANNGQPGLYAGGFNKAADEMNQAPYDHVYKLFETMFGKDVFEDTTSKAAKRESIWSFRNKEQPTPNKEKDVKSNVPEVEIPSTTKPKQADRKIITVAVRYHGKIEFLTIPQYCTLGQLKSIIQSTFHIKHYIYCYASQELSDPFMLEDGALIQVVDSPHKWSYKVEQKTPKKYKGEPPTLTLPNYTITPSLQKLSTLLNSELEAVDHVVIECKGIGKIAWEEPVNLRGVNLDDVICIEKSGVFPNISVYENMDNNSPDYPPLGSGLNHPAVLTFYGVFPPDGVSKERFLSYLKHYCQTMEGTFVSYDDVTGNWSIRVPHFTRYGLDGWDGMIEVAEERPLKVLHIAEQKAKPTKETDDEEVQRIVKGLRSDSNFPKFAAYHTALLQNENLVETNFTSVKISHLHHPLSSQIQSNLHSLLQACHPVDEESECLVPQLQPPMGRELQQFVSQLHASSLTEESSQNPNHAANDPLSNPKESEYCSLFWELFEVLFCETLNGQEEYIATDPASFSHLQLSAVKRRRLHFSRWLDRLVRSSLWEGYNDASDSFGFAVQCLLRHDVWSACEALRKDCFDRLAVQVAQINCSDDFRTTMMLQLADWRKNGQVAAMSPSQLFLVSLLAGDWETCTTFPLNWVQFLGITFWYAQSTSLPLESALQLFLRGVEQPSFNVEPCIGSREGKEGLIHLLQLFSQMRSHTAVDFNALFSEQNFSSDGWNSGIPFLTSLLLSSCPTLLVPPVFLLKLLSAFAEQLEAAGEWLLACVVCMFHPYEPVRIKLIRNLISRHLESCGVSKGTDDIHTFADAVRSDASIQFLLKDLGIAPTVVFSELVEYARACDDVELEVVCRMELGEFTEAFALVLRYYIFPDVLENRMDSVREELLLFRDHVSDVSSWERIGAVISQYVELISGSVNMTCEETLSLLNSIERMQDDANLLKGNDMVRMIQEMRYQVLLISIELLRSSDGKEGLLEQVAAQINALGNYYIKKIRLQDSLKEIILIFSFIC